MIDSKSNESDKKKDSNEPRCRIECRVLNTIQNTPISRASHIISKILGSSKEQVNLPSAFPASHLNLQRIHNFLWFATIESNE
jgi:hypothetical protein